MKRGALEKIGDIVDMIQKSGSEVTLQMSGLRFITKVLEDEPGQERQLIKVEGGLSVRSVPPIPHSLTIVAGAPRAIPDPGQRTGTRSCGWENRIFCADLWKSG